MRDRNDKKWQRYVDIDSEYTTIDKKYVRNSRRHLRMIPDAKHRMGGKQSYLDWGYAAGIFHALLASVIKKPSGIQVLDMGCGTGFMAIATSPFLSNGGSYIGIDVSESRVNFCKKNYNRPNYSFLHVNQHNPAYSPHQSNNTKNIPISDSTIDLFTAISVWTHLNEEDSIQYIKEVERVLSPGGIALITMFVIDELHMNALENKSETNIFSENAYGSDDWLYPERFSIPEKMIGITTKGLEKMSKTSGLELYKYLPSSKKIPYGLYNQDIVIFRKNNS